MSPQELMNPPQQSSTEPPTPDNNLIQETEYEVVEEGDGGMQQALLQDAQQADEPTEPEPAKPKSTLLFGSKFEALPDKVAEAAQLMQELEQPESDTPNTPNQGVAVINQQIGFQQAQSPKDLLTWGTMLFQSNVFPSVKSPQEAVARILMARSLRIDEMKAMYMLHPIDGKLVLSADLTRYLLDRAGVRYKIIQDRGFFNNPGTLKDDYLTHIKMAQGPTDKPTKLVEWKVWWSELEVFWNGKNKETWRKFPRAMQLHACMRQCARFYFPAILGGFYEADELGHADGDTFAEQV